MPFSSELYGNSSGRICKDGSVSSTSVQRCVIKTRNSNGKPDGSSTKDTSAASRNIAAAAGAGATHKWGGMALQLPAALLGKLHTFESAFEMITSSSTGGGSGASGSSSGDGGVTGGSSSSSSGDGGVTSGRSSSSSGDNGVTGGRSSSDNPGFTGSSSSGGDGGVTGDSSSGGGGSSCDISAASKATSTSPEQLLVLQLMLQLCGEVIAKLSLPLGCNNPACVRLAGSSEAGVAKVCTGCRKVLYCSNECIKAHWEEHQQFCRK